MNKERPPDKKGKFETQMITCPKCKGKGKVEYPNGKRAVSCPSCKGKGKIAA